MLVSGVNAVHCYSRVVLELFRKGHGTRSTIYIYIHIYLRACVGVCVGVVLKPFGKLSRLTVVDQMFCCPLSLLVEELQGF